MNITKEEVQQVLDALLYWKYKNDSDGRIHTGCALYFNLIPLLRSKLAEKDDGEPVAWATHHEEPMLFPTRKEALEYCEDDEGPIPLYTHPTKQTPMRDDELTR